MILVDAGTKLVVQGLTGSQGRFHGLRNRAYGTQVVAGVTPGKGGTDVEGIPVFDTVAEAVAATGADASLVLVPARAAAAAVVEAADAGIALVVCITEGIPLHDEARIVAHLRRNAPGTRLLGPNCPGVICPGQVNIGIIPGEIALGGGPVGVVSRSGTLTYQALYELTRQGIGQTTCVGIGGDPVPGTGFIDCLELFEADPETRAVILIGEIGGADEEAAAAFIADHMAHARRRLRRRRHRPARPQDGPRRRHRVGLRRRGGRQDRGPGGRRRVGGEGPDRAGPANCRGARPLK